MDSISKMGCLDFLKCLGPDISTAVLSLLDDPADLVRASAVSRSWSRFVISNGLSKQLCLRLCPEASHFTRVFMIDDSIRTVKVGYSSAEEWELKKEHRVYSFLGHLLISVEGNMDCISQPISASSTDQYPSESILNTLEPSHIVGHRASYWSSGGQADPSVPESLTYRLKANLCIVEEIKILPFKAFFQFGNPIYSARSVHFRMGYSNVISKMKNYTFDGHESLLAAEQNYNWTYVSPEFPMIQENVLQSFKLPHPVICIGGVLQIQLMGRVQKQESDGLYYICVCHVQVIGRPLPTALDVDIASSDRPAHPDVIVLKYFPGCRERTTNSNNLTG